MSSFISGYNYDIFISYRQKDNKHDGWVTEFVDNLKGELESTFKEEISVYFDINPHDGLLETHDVDASLKDKLKCLIFIPIISRTYCDPKAFAWEHEFKAFVEQASKDEYGLKVKLTNGNVASRVLPIIIFDLDKQDIKLCESILNGTLRGVEFIYKSAGVNRPLRSKDDLIIESGKVFYRDQVNKVANSIKDVLNSLTAREPSVEEAIPEPTIVDKTISTKRPLKKKTRVIPSVSFLYRLKNLVALSPKAWEMVGIGASILALCFGIFMLARKTAPAPPDRPQIRYDIPLNDYINRLGRKSLTISPNGKYLAYVMDYELNLMQMGSDAPSIPISGTSNSRSPFFSPDGEWIGFVKLLERKIMKVPLAGGNPVTICDLEANMNTANWYESEIIFESGSAIYRVPDSGGTPEMLYPLVKSKNDPRIWNPQLLPDKKTLLFSQQLEDGGWSILTWRLGSKESPVVLVERGRDGRYLKSGHLVYSMNRRLYICKFNTKTNRIFSEPQAILTNPIMETSLYGSSQFDFSENGILVYYEQQQQTEQRHLVWVDQSGAVMPITNEPKRYTYTAISPDAQYIASSIFTGDEFKLINNIEIINMKTGNSQLFAEEARCPVWSADNSSVIYVSNISRNQVFQKSLDLSKPPVLLFEVDSAINIFLQNLSSDGRHLPFYALLSTGYDIGYYDMINNEVKMLDHYNTDKTEDGPTISPNGRWLAYRSDFDGLFAIYVAPFPGPGQPHKVTLPRKTNDIYSPIWAPDMTALYYRTINPDFELWKIAVLDSKENLSFEEAQSFFNGGNRFSMTIYNLEIHPNGDRFLIRQMAFGTEEFIEPRIKVIVNWEQELEGN